MRSLLPPKPNSPLPKLPHNPGSIGLPLHQGQPALTPRPSQASCSHPLSWERYALSRRPTHRMPGEEAMCPCNFPAALSWAPASA